MFFLLVYFITLFLKLLAFLFIVTYNLLIAFSLKLNNHNTFPNFIFFCSYCLSPPSPASESVQTLQSRLLRRALHLRVPPSSLRTSLPPTSTRSLTTSMLLHAADTLGATCPTTDQHLITPQHFPLLFFCFKSRQHLLFSSPR